MRDREAAIRDSFPRYDKLLAELAAARRTQELADEDHGLIVERLEEELAAAREEVERLRWWLGTRPDSTAGLPATWLGWDRRVRAALADGEGET